MSGHVIAVDLGAESGRVMRVQVDEGGLRVEEVHRFPNIPVKVRQTLYWDALRLWHEITTGIDAAADGALSVGVDAWGVDFALLDRQGNLLGNPVHYRDSRTEGMYDWVFARVPKRTIFERTGLQFMHLNTLYQIASMVRDNSPLLEIAAHYLSFPDLIHYWLSGERAGEFTHATTTQMYNPRTCDWDRETMQALGIPTHIFPPVVQPGTRLGEYKGIPVIAPATHDTGSAVVGVPTTTDDYAYLSSGTWSLLGLETREPVISEGVFEANVTNEGGAYGTFRFLKNVVGLWIAQQCRATWRAEGHDFSYDELTRLAVDAEPFRSFIDPDDAVFIAPGDMPARIREWCARTDQPVPETPGQIMRTVYESLALKYRYALERLIALSGRTVNRLHVIGGGSQNALLCQMTADAIHRPVIAGPAEATAIGNAIVQLIALGRLKDIAEGRTLLSRAAQLVHYEPKHGQAWEDAYGRFAALVNT